MDDRTLECEIETLLAVEPAPDLRLRLRQRIAEEPPLDVAGSRRRLPWAFATGAALTAALAIALLVLPDTASPPAVIPNRARPIDPYPSPTVTDARAGQDFTPAGLRTLNNSRHANTTMSMEVILDPSEVASWRRLLGELRSNRVELAFAAQTRERPVPVSDDLGLPPLVIAPLAPEASEEGVHP